jgi:chemotaxis protein CheC
LVVAFEQESGLALADILMGRPLGTSTQWSELERSAALETTNIVGCAYLNSLSSHLPESRVTGEMIPSPPEFRQDFAASLLEALLLDQALYSDQVLVIRSQFTRDQTQLCWHLMLVPDLESLSDVVGALGEDHKKPTERV